MLLLGMLFVINPSNKCSCESVTTSKETQDEHGHGIDLPPAGGSDVPEECRSNWCLSMYCPHMSPQSIMIVKYLCDCKHLFLLRCQCCDSCTSWKRRPMFECYILLWQTIQMQLLLLWGCFVWNEVILWRPRKRHASWKQLKKALSMKKKKTNAWNMTMDTYLKLVHAMLLSCKCCQVFRICVLVLLCCWCCHCIQLRIATAAPFGIAGDGTAVGTPIANCGARTRQTTNAEKHCATVGATAANAATTTVGARVGATAAHPATTTVGIGATAGEGWWST